MKSRETAPEEINQRLKRLRELEEVIGKGIDAWVVTGRALMEVRDEKLYLETNGTLAEWAHERFKISHTRTYELMGAVKVHDNLSAMADTAPANERQARELTRLGEPDQLKAWNKAVELAGEDALTEKHVKQAVRSIKYEDKIDALRASISEVAPLGGIGRFPVLLADPPWRYDSGTADPSRRIENQYSTMSIEDICAMSLDEVAMDDAVLFLWATAPLLPEALRVMSEWGFSYTTCAVWDKVKIGLGFWFRGQHELLLVGTRGKPPKPEPSSRVRSIIKSPRGTHSVKPPEVHEIIEAYYPGLPKVELFARDARPGWAAWGNEV